MAGGSRLGVGGEGVRIGLIIEIDKLEVGGLLFHLF